jgi:hypothetical protein
VVSAAATAAMESTPAVVSAAATPAVESAPAAMATTATMTTATSSARYCQARRQHNDQCKTPNRFQARIHLYFSSPGR